MVGSRKRRSVLIVASMLVIGGLMQVPSGASARRRAAAKPAATQDSLERGFRNPPHAALPHTWWHWVNGNVSKEGITADLEAMKRVGIGGAQIFNVDVGIPAGPAPFMGAKWTDLIAHAVKEAHRLGIEICVHNGAGWSSSGGPWITPANAMQRLTWTETAAHGPAQFSETLARPNANAGYYRDVTVLAFKTPESEVAPGGTKLRIRDINVKACFERGGRILPDISPAPDGEAVDRGSIVDLTSRMDSDGKLTWDVPDGDWTILRIGSTPTGAMNEPAPRSGLGLEVDKLSRAAFDTHWAGMMATVINAAGPLAGKTLNNALIDSYEVGSQNWTPRFREEFQKRRGYDPLPFLPVVTGRVVQSSETSERFLWDFRRTIADLYADNYYGYLAELCHKHGMEASSEVYGNGPFDNIQSGGRLDIPMGEFWVGGGTLETCKLASSTGHVHGRNIVGAESFTADDQHAKWMYDPYSLKALGDLVFCLGINRYIYHRYAAQPWLNLKPGMTMGPWGTNFDRTNTWWYPAAAWQKYVARCQDLLQQGRFVADICYMYGEDGPNDLSGRSGIQPAIPEGYDYDGADAGVILNRMTVKNGRLVLPDGMSYRILVLPEDRFMTPAMARKIRDLVRGGATVVAPKPNMSPSLSGYPASDDEVRSIAQEVWGDADGKSVTSHRFGKGRVIWGQPLARVLRGMADPPDFEYPTKTGAARIVYIHRQTQGADLYFVSNQRYSPVDVTCTFRVAGKTPELFHPDTGVVEPAPIYQASGGRTAVRLHFDPAGSVFVVFRRPISDKVHYVSITRAGRPSGKPGRSTVLRIQSARYESADGRGADVTSKVADMVASGEASIPASNSLFGDPVPLVVKRLHVVYILNGKTVDRTVPENETLELGGPARDETSLPEFEVTGHSLIPWTPGTYNLVLVPDRARAGVPTDGLRVSVKSASMKIDAKDPPTTQGIGGSWRLSFPPGLGAPPTATFDHLISWPDSPNPGVKYFSGTATYTKTIDVPAALAATGRAVYLDLGRVKNLAEVVVNGRNLGVLWKAPFRVEVTGLLKPGPNTLVVRVTNLWPNRFVGDEQYPDDVQWNPDGTLAKWPDWVWSGQPRPVKERVTFATWKFFGKNSPLLESGLLGPVVIRSVKPIPLQ